MKMNTFQPPSAISMLLPVVVYDPFMDLISYLAQYDLVCNAAIGLTLIAVIVLFEKALHKAFLVD